LIETCMSVTTFVVMSGKREIVVDISLSVNAEFKPFFA
jgi:hypothetical protein